MKRIFNNPLLPASLLIAAVALLLPAVAWLEFSSNRKNLDLMLSSKGTALMEAVLHSAENAVLAEREIAGQIAARLEDVARHVLILEQEDAFTEAALDALAASGDDLARIEVYAAEGSLLLSSDPRHSPARLPAAFDSLRADSGPLSLLVQGPEEDLLAVAVRAGDGRAGAAYAPADEILELRHRLGIGLILDDLSAVEGVAYAVLQDTLGIIAASSEVVEIGSLAGDSFFPLPRGEIRGRYRDFSGEEVYELATRFELGGEEFGYLRVGLATREVRSIAELDLQRLIFGMGALAVLAAVALLLWFFRGRHLRLEREHAQLALRNEKFKTLAEVSASVAHEIRNPLNSIGMNVQRLKIEFAPCSEDENRQQYEEFIDIIRREIERINDIVEQFLSLARFSGPRLEQAEINSLLRETLEFFSAELAGDRITIETNIEPAAPFLFDPAQIRQVLMNLVRNAAEAMPEGGTLSVTGRALPAAYEFSVHDTGPGITGNNMKEIFEPFFTTRKNGLGLGLAVSQRIVTEHGGEISVDSGPGTPGTTFTVSLLLKKDKEKRP
ncbi:MAG: ATP-binding protein [Gemmatimonadota bacterium]|nr:ATP-binding protein [Gemmatimonadota bacterium]